MRKKFCILLGLMLSMRVLAMTVEQEQRFLYYFYEAERLWQNERYADAFVMYEFCHALNPDDAITNRYLGHIYHGCKMDYQALVHYKMAWDKAPTECWKEYAITLYNTGIDESKQKAVQVMEKTSKLLPQDEDLWEHLRDAYIGVHKYKQALQAQYQMDQIIGYSAYSAINRYRIHLLMQDSKKAINDLEEYLKEDPTNLQFQLYRMQLYESTKQPVKVLIPIYQQILRLDPYNALVLNNYAYALACNRGDLKVAEKASAKAVQTEPTNPTYLDTYAWILYLTGQKKLAELYIHQAISLYKEQTIPKEVLMHYHTILSK